MRINDLLLEDKALERALDEGPIGAAIGKGVGAVTKGVGAVAGGVAGLGRAFKKGYTSGRAAVSGEPDASTDKEPAAGKQDAPISAADINREGPKGTASAVQQTGSAAQALQKTAKSLTDKEPDQAGQTMYAMVKSQIDQLDKKGKQRILQLLQKSIQQEPEDDNGQDKTPPEVKTQPAVKTTTPRKKPSVETPAQIRQRKQAAAIQNVQSTMKEVPKVKPKASPNFSQGNYNVPSGSLPSTTSAATVQKGLAKAQPKVSKTDFSQSGQAKYNVPTGGLPSTTSAASVQKSLPVKEPVAEPVKKSRPAAMTAKKKAPAVAKPAPEPVKKSRPAAMTAKKKAVQTAGVINNKPALRESFSLYRKK